MFDGHRIREWETELTKAIRREEVYWRTKSRVQWLREGDKNTRFFHAQTLKLRMRNAIHGLEKEDGTWCTDRHRMHGLAVQYFQTLFSTDRPANFMQILPCMQRKVRDMDNNLLIALVTDMEIETALY